VNRWVAPHSNKREKDNVQCFRISAQVSRFGRLYFRMDRSKWSANAGESNVHGHNEVNATGNSAK
jgi:hypothetical protein